MKAKTANRIEIAIDLLLSIIYLPFNILFHISKLIYEFFDWIDDYLIFFVRKIGHWLFLKCDEKHIVKNDNYVRTLTARAFYKWLEEEYKKEQE